MLKPSQAKPQIISDECKPPPPTSHTDMFHAQALQIEGTSLVSRTALSPTDTLIDACHSHFLAHASRCTEKVHRWRPSLPSSFAIPA